mgnify:CR=1 FL=1|jgi:hypothetical protein
MPANLYNTNKAKIISKITQGACDAMDTGNSTNNPCKISLIIYYLKQS